jgi:thiol-disulfide isomerase/thioredoxin
VPPDPSVPLVPCCPPPESGGGDLVAFMAVVGLLLVAHAIVQFIRNRKRNPKMKNWKQGLALGALLLAGAGLLANQRNRSYADSPSPESDAPGAAIGAGLPALLELGADRCIPCQQMKPIIDELKTTFDGQLHVEFIDVWKNPDEGHKYNVTSIPLQIFFDVEGKELFRHVGFFSREDILAKWKELGVELKTP